MFGKLTAGKVTTEPATYTPTLSDATNATIVKSQWWRDGKHMEVETLITWAGAGAGSTFTITIPSGYTIDTNFLTGGTDTTNQQATFLGKSAWFDSGAGWATLDVVYASTTTVKFNNNTGVITGTQFASGDGLKVNFRVPIVGWMMT